MCERILALKGKKLARLTEDEQRAASRQWYFAEQLVENPALAVKLAEDQSGFFLCRPTIQVLCRCSAAPPGPARQVFHVAWLRSRWRWR
jgi:hypothetical protein